MSANGRLAPSELVTVQGSIQLSPPTARAYARLRAVCLDATGIAIAIATPAGGYRSYAMQADMKANPAKYGLNRNSSIPIASAGSSTHGFGDRVDIVPQVGPAFTWVLAHAAEFGFKREFGSADPNHFRHDGVTAAGTIPPTLIPQEEEDDMAGQLRFGYYNDGGRNRYTVINYATGAIWQTYSVAEATQQSANLKMTAEKWTAQEAANLVANMALIGPPRG